MDKLRLLLGLNAVSCFAFGALFVFAPSAAAQFLGGNVTVDLLRTLGVALLFNSVHLAIAARRRHISPGTIYYFSAADLLWVNLTLVLVASGRAITTPHGATAALAIAAVVGALGLLQVGALARSRQYSFPSDDHLPSELSTLRAIGWSWIALKTWVKIWLFGLNAVFLASIAFWPEPLAKLVLACYVASGPWLFAIMIAQRGLTRLLGIAHLIPWLPLLAYLLLRLSTDLSTARLHADARPLYVYTTTLVVVMTICLALDAFDAWRWWRGDRFRLGSIAAAKAGASRLAVR